jgi:hypothetical protein
MSRTGTTKPSTPPSRIISREHGDSADRAESTEQEKSAEPDDHCPLAGGAVSAACAPAGCR